MVIHDFSDAIELLKTGATTYTGHRLVAAALDKGRATAPTDTPFTFVATIVPITGNELQRLPEGMRTLEPIKIYTSTQLLAGASGSQLPDVVDYLGKTYEVEKVENWAESGNFYVATATKRER